MSSTESHNVANGNDAAPFGMESPTADSSSAPALIGSPPGADEQPGARIGPYQILQLIGEGGFGRVYLAEQHQPIRRRVAIKIIKLGMDTRQVVARFEQERQALAIMDHPSIAKVLDAGATPSGRPYFVMELCTGESITSFCDKNSLSIRQRLELVTQVCDAVQHAHQKGIIHRDIKPTNVLVSMQDGRALAKVIDFGVAKATSSRMTERTLFTEHRQLIGTPEYMSPEQAEGSLDIDTRTDVYALGVVLYELLTGSTPFDAKSLRSAAFGEIQRIIREIDPPRPSTRISQNSGSIASVAAKRLLEPRKLGSMVRGELDWIVMRAIEKDRSRRYASPSDLAADIRRYLGGEAVVAAPPGAGYRARKFLRRNRAPVLAGTVVVLALLAGAIGTTVGLIRASHERDQAKAARDDAEAVTEFLSSTLAAADPSQLGKDVTVREVMDKASKRLGPSIEARPRVEAQLRATLGKTYSALGEYGQAQRNIDRALELSRREFGDEGEWTLRLSALKGESLYRLGKYAESEALLNKTLESATRTFGRDSTPAIETRTVLGTLLADQARGVEAEGMMRTLIDTHERTLGAEHEQTLGAQNNLGVILTDLEKYDQADALFLRTIETLMRTLGADHPLTLATRGNYAWSLQAQGKSAESAKISEEVLEGRRRVLGLKHRETNQTENNLAVSYRALGRNDEAGVLYESALATNRELQGSEHPDTLITMANVSRFYMETGKHDRALALFEECEALYRKVLGLDHPQTAHTMLGHGICLGKMKLFDRAEAKLKEAHALLCTIGSPSDSAARRAAQEIIMVYDATGRTAEAAEARAELKKVTPPKPASP